MVEIIVRTVFILLFILLAAWNISASITEYIDGRYFVGSVNAMIAFWMALNVIRVFFDW